MPTLTTFIQHSIRSPSPSNQTRKIKGIQIGKVEVKLSLFVDEMILYIENPKDSTKKLPELNEFDESYRIQIVQTSVAFLYTNKKLSERDIKEAIPFTTASKRIKYLEINLTKEVKTLYSENCKTLMKKLKTNRWKDIMCSWIGRILLK